MAEGKAMQDAAALRAFLADFFFPLPQPRRLAVQSRRQALTEDPSRGKHLTFSSEQLLSFFLVGSAICISLYLFSEMSPGDLAYGLAIVSAITRAGLVNRAYHLSSRGSLPAQLIEIIPPLAISPPPAFEPDPAIRPPIAIPAAVR